MLFRSDDLNLSEELDSQQPLPRYEMLPKLMGSLFSCSPCSTNTNSESPNSPRKLKSSFANRLPLPPLKSFEEISDSTPQDVNLENKIPKIELVLESPECIRPVSRLLEGVGPYFQALEKGGSLDILARFCSQGDIIERNSDKLNIEENRYGFASKKLINFMDYFECRVFQLKLKARDIEYKSLISDSSKAYIEMSLDEFKDKFQRNQLSVSKNGIKPKSILKKPTKGQKPEERRLSVGPSALNLETKNQKKVLFSSNYMVLHYTPSRKSSTSKNSTQKRKSSFSNFR